MQRHIVGRLWKRAAQSRGLLLVAIASAIISVPLNLLGPVFIGGAIDGIVTKGNVDFPAVGRQLLWLGLSIGASALSSWVLQVSTRKLSARVAQGMRIDAYAVINKLPLARIDSHRHGDIVSRLVNDADAVAEGLLQGLGQLLPGMVTILCTIGVMLALSVPIGLAVILITPLSILFARFVGGRSGRYFRAQSAALGGLSGFAGERIRGQGLLEAFGAQETSQAQFERINREYFETNFKATFYSSVINPGTRLINAIVYAAVGMLGALYAIAGGITVGGLSAFLSYANQYTKPFNEITAVLTQMQAAVASAERLFEIMDWPIETPDEPDAARPTTSAGEISLQDVCFSYDPEQKLIHDLRFTAYPGQRIALVGPTGCGKTTIINLLMRFYEIKAGSITVDGTETRDIQRDALRGLFGMVLQDTWLKKATVLENIAYGRPGADEEEVVKAAKAAKAHSFIKRLPQGYDTIIQTGGDNLSAGQKQLLCIARILLARPDMLILDEATSSIDTRTEILVQQALEKLMQGHTSIIVAHRLSTIQNADVILVMNKGQIVERGSHQELMSRDGFYKNLYNSQFSLS